MAYVIENGIATCKLFKTYLLAIYNFAKFGEKLGLDHVESYLCWINSTSCDFFCKTLKKASKCRAEKVLSVMPWRFINTKQTLFCSKLYDGEKYLNPTFESGREEKRFFCER